MFHDSQTFIELHARGIVRLPRGGMFYEITVPMVVPSQNAYDRWHWARKLREAKAWQTQIRKRVLAAGAPAASGKRVLHLLAYRKRRIMDRANLIGGAKHVVDACTLCGVIVDDRDTLADIHYGQDLASNSPTGRECTIISYADAAK